MDEIERFRLEPDAIRWIGAGLSRPECVVALPDGTVWVSDDRSALLRLDPDGGQRRVGAIGGKPNGFAVDRDGVFWIAEIESGRLFRMEPDGRHTVVLDRFDGRPLGSANFVLADRGRLWVTVSTRLEPRSRAIETPTPDGFVLRIDAPDRVPCRPVLALGGLCFTNEVRIDAQRRHLYVAETAVGAIARCRFGDDGRLGPLEPFGPRPLFDGALVDGIAFDAAGNLWVTEISRNALLVLRPDGSMHEVFSDPAGTVLVAPTSIAFSGPDLRTVVVGSLRMDRLATFRSPVPGLPPDHWPVP